MGQRPITGRGRAAKTHGASLLPGRYWHISRNALVRMGDIAQVSGHRLLVVDVAAKARQDVATLLKAHITDFTVLRGGGRNYRTVMRMGTY